MHAWKRSRGVMDGLEEGLFRRDHHETHEIHERPKPSGNFVCFVCFVVSQFRMLGVPLVGAFVFVGDAEEAGFAEGLAD